MAYTQKGKINLARNEVIARVRFEMALAVRQLIDEVVPPIQAQFDQRIQLENEPDSLRITAEDVQTELREALLRRLAPQEAARVLPARKR